VHKRAVGATLVVVGGAQIDIRVGGVVAAEEWLHGLEDWDLGKILPGSVADDFVHYRGCWDSFVRTEYSKVTSLGRVPGLQLALAGGDGCTLLNLTGGATGSSATCFTIKVWDRGLA
jgi:hypothetical protein